MEGGPENAAYCLFDQLGGPDQECPGWTRTSGDRAASCREDVSCELERHCIVSAPALRQLVEVAGPQFAYVDEPGQRATGAPSQFRFEDRSGRDGSTSL